MAFVIYRKNHFKEDLELHDGDNTLTLHVDLHVDAIMQKYVEITRLIDRLHGSKGDETEEKIKRFTDAVRDYFVLILGVDQAEQLFQFYGNNPAELLSDVLPFIVDKLNPAIAAAQRRMAKSYRK